jgi:hypothetical protein
MDCALRRPARRRSAMVKAGSWNSPEMKRPAVGGPAVDDRSLVDQSRHRAAPVHARHHKRRAGRTAKAIRVVTTGFLVQHFGSGQRLTVDASDAPMALASTRAGVARW